VKKRIAVILAFVLLLPLASVGWIGLSEAGLQWIYQQLQDRVPGKLVMKELQGRLFSHIEFSDLDYRSGELQVRSDHTRLQWNALDLLFGHVDIESLAFNNLAITLPTEQTGTGQNTPPGLPYIPLPAHVDLRRLDINGLLLQQGEQQYPIKQVNAELATRLLQLNIKTLGIEAEQYRLKLAGNVELTQKLRHHLKLDWSGRLPSGDELSGHGLLKGDINKTLVEQVLEQPSPIVVNGIARDLLGALTWQADVTVKDFDAAQWKYELPEFAASTQFSANGDLNSAAATGKARVTRKETGPVDAAFRLSWPGGTQVDIHSLHLDVKKAAMAIDAEGMWHPGELGGKVDLALQWNNLRWPIEGDAWFASEKGRGKVQGGLDNYQFEVRTSRPWPEAPQSDWFAKGSGDMRQLSLDEVNIETLGGRIDATGKLAWQDHFTWQAQAEGKQIDPQSLYPDWLGKLDASVTSNGSVQNRQISSDMVVKKLQGMLRGYPVTASSELGWRKGGLDIKRLDFQSGGSRLKTSGRVDDRFTLEWSLVSSNLAELLPQAEGQLKANGTLNGNRQQPVLSARVDGKSLAYQVYHAGEVNGQVKLDLMHPERVDVDLRASSLRLDQRPLDRLELKGNAGNMTVKAVAGDYGADLQLTGTANDQGWLGKLQKADLTLGPLQQWKLAKPIPLGFAQQALTAERGCWISGQESMFCGDVRWQQDIWTSSLDLTALPLQRLQDWLPKDVRLDSVVDGKAQLRFQDQGLLGDIALDLPAGKVFLPLQSGEVEDLPYQSGNMRIHLKPQGMESNAELVLNDAQKLVARLELPGGRLPGIDPDTQKLKGRVEINLDDLTFAELWLPEVQNLEGKVAASMNVAGTLKSPEVDGRLSLTKSTFRIPRLGLKIKKIELTGHSEGLDRFNYQLSARSGDGKLKVDGSIEQDKQGQWFSRMTVKGEDFEVSRIPEAQVLASPDLTVTVKPYRVEIEGSVSIPYAHLEPRDISTAVRVSNDVVIVGEEQAPDKRWVIVSRVQVKLGERVHFFGFGFEGRLGGQVLVEEEPGLPARARGEISIEDGRYRAYGQRLDIQEGRLIFSGGPLTKPGLDVRAVRQIDTITVGVRALGTISEPQIELFSTPAMGQTDILSYLLLGRPLENASNQEGEMMAKAALAMGLTGGDSIARSLRETFGLDEMRLESNDNGDQASLVIGRYLSPRLYVSYGIGLIEAFNTFIVRYQISKRWQLKAESGESHGADLIFTIER
jgi:translocation and assembly module TamB